MDDHVVGVDERGGAHAKLGDELRRRRPSQLVHRRVEHEELHLKGCRVELRENDFGIEPELTARVCLRKLRIYELPIAYYGRTYAEGKKITWRDGFKAIGVLLRIRILG